MANYLFQEIERKWQAYWEEHQTFKVQEDPSKPKYYVLDMFPYPSGAGLHVGHPLGYIATDIFARYKTLKGYNVLHPMGFDAFGLPAETYAIETGIHPRISTAQNIHRYKQQLKKLGIAYDWSREVVTCDPYYYRWTQWLFLKIFNAWFDNDLQKARTIEELISIFEQQGNVQLKAACHENTPQFTADEWKQFPENHKQKILLNYRLAYLDEMYVNWCPALGCVLANDEVINGRSERGGHPVEKKLMKQWALRISAFAERLLKNLDTLEWSEALKEQQRNWIGKSQGATVHFAIQGTEHKLTVFTTRIDTIFGVTFIALAPEHPLLHHLLSPKQLQALQPYLQQTLHKTERERIADNSKPTGAFTGLYAFHPFSQKPIPIYIADYVIATYGTGAVMGVPAADERDFRFANALNLPIIPIFEGTENLPNPTEKPYGTLINSDFLNGKSHTDAQQILYELIQQKQIGTPKTQYKIRDAVFARQRYWGEPIPIYYKEGIPYALLEDQLPLLLPEIDKYLPTETGEPPLARAKAWTTSDGFPLETNTMPGWAGSSWYFLRYMSPTDNQHFVNPDAEKYWGQVDLYVGGTEHAVGHLLYARFWNMLLYDLKLISNEEPFKKLVNQGMIQGRSAIVYRINGTNTFVSKNLAHQYQTTPLRVDVRLVENDILNIEAFKQWRPEFKEADFILEENGQYLCDAEIEKMSKRWHNVVNPDDICEKYGADTFRLYEMFLGPIEQHKPWNTSSITGAFNFLKKLLNLFFNENNELIVNHEEPTSQELKILHQTIKKVEEDCEKLSFNTSVAQFMICTNELTKLNCRKRAILEPLLIILSPFAPHLCEELWQQLGHNHSIFFAKFPNYNPDFLVENNFEYPISINGKLKTKIQLPLNFDSEQIQEAVLKDEKVKNLISGKNLKKIIVVHGKIVNIVV